MKKTRKQPRLVLASEVVRQLSDTEQKYVLGGSSTDVCSEGAVLTCTARPH